MSKLSGRNMVTRDEILSEIDREIDNHIVFLQDFIRTPSPNPPGDTREAARVIIDFLSKHGIEAETIAPQITMPNIVSDFLGGKGSGPRVILNGHIDAFPPGEPDRWERGPYSGHNDGKSIHGRGSVDMKTGTAASVIAYTLLKRRADSMRGSVALTAVSDEETGGKWGARYLLEHGGDPSPWKGDCVINGEPGGLQSVRFGEKGTLRITFTVHTKGALGAYKHLSRGANIVAAQLISRLLEIENMVPDLPDGLRKYFDNPEVRAVADEIMGTGAADVLLAPTLNIGTIHGGIKVNVIPEQCVFEADVRLPIGMLAESVIGQIEEILKDFPGVSFKTQEAASNPANYCAVDHPFAERITKVAGEVTKHKPVLLTGLGGTDCKFWRYAGIPAYVYGPSPKSMGATGESVSIDEFKAVIKTHTLAVWDFLSGPD